ncbi:Polysaccharide pyruvyl transferase [Lachnospiraceae bacterium]|nr:Polysaccharide pyruvyl transferase [Lachnospiraceae bacterium]
MDKKTGILTLSSAQNYGAVLQCHSLCKYLNDHFSNTEIIDFTPKFIVGRYSLIYIDKSSFFRMFETIISSFLNYPVKYLKRKRFNKFRRKCSVYSDKRIIGHLADDDYDQYIVGSDQVYNLELTGYDTEFFLPTVKDGMKKATYAASLGVSMLNEEKSSILLKGLSDFGYLSFRETVGCELIANLFPDKKIERLIDPVFLNEKKYWTQIASKRKYSRPYILIYSFINFDRAYNIARDIDKYIDIIMINDGIKKMKSDVINARGIGPKEFLSLILYADYIITDSFHGTAFSVIFNKKFFSIPYKGTESRVVDMLELFGLGNRIIYDEDSAEKIVLNIKDNIDYNYVNKCINKEKEKTKNYFCKIYGKG